MTGAAGGAAGNGARSPVLLRHGRVDLALHPLRAGAPGGHPLLLLPGLGEATPEAPPPAVEGWPGPVWGLDLTGHGRSGRSVGGGYTAEILLADVDRALAHLGPATVVGRGLGAYLALLAAGARPRVVRGAVLLDGPGLAGGGPAPGSPPPPLPPGVELPPGPPDPFVLHEMSRDIRPPDYAVTFVHQAVQLSGLDAPLTVAALVRPPWLEAVAAAAGVAHEPLPVALARYAGAAARPDLPDGPGAPR